MFVLGINAFHGDSSACLIQDGRIIAAAEEERFRRIKHWAGFPSMAIAYCIRQAGIELSEVEHIAINQDSKANLGKKMVFTLTKRPDLAMVLDRIRNKRERAGVAEHLAQAFPESSFKGKVHAVEHHVAHLSSAFHVSPFHQAVVVSVDGFGDFASAAWGVGKGTEINVEERVYFPHSLGIFYQALTQYLGFPHYGDEYKVMGLAPYGEPKYLKQMREIVKLESDGSFKLNLDYFRHHKEKVEYEWEDGLPSVGILFSEKLIDLLGPARTPDQALDQYHKDLARSIQAMYEEAFFHLLNTLHAKHGIDQLAIAGGCGMNSVANGKVTLRTPFKEIYVQSAAGDAGGAIGAAYAVWHELGGARGPEMDHAFWGPEASNDEIETLLQQRAEDITTQACTVKKFSDESQLCEKVAANVAAGFTATVGAGLTATMAAGLVTAVVTGARTTGAGAGAARTTGAGAGARTIGAGAGAARTTGAGAGAGRAAGAVRDGAEVDVEVVVLLSAPAGCENAHDGSRTASAILL